MTLSQLQSFAAIARLGSVKAAARELGVSEPTVSQAATALRQELGDELYVRGDGGIHLTPGGRRLATAAAEILGLADQARRGVREARGDVATLRVAASAGVAELAAPPLLKAFARRNAGVDVRLQVARDGSIARLLSDRVVDVVLGPRPRGDSAYGIESIPFLRYGLVVVAAPQHPLAARRDIAPAALADEPWLTGPSGAEPSTTTGAFFAREGLAPGNVRTFPSHAAARAGGGGAGSHARDRARGAGRARARRAGGARRPGHAGRAPVVREHARPGPPPARRLGAAAVRRDARGHAGDAGALGRAIPSVDLREPVELRDKEKP